MKTFGVATWTYNQAVQDIRKYMSLLSMQKMRAYCLSSDAPLIHDKSCVKAIMYDIRDDAAKEVLLAIKSAKAKVKNGTLKVKNPLEYI